MRCDIQCLNRKGRRRTPRDPGPFARPPYPCRPSSSFLQGNKPLNKCHMATNDVSKGRQLPKPHRKRGRETESGCSSGLLLVSVLLSFLPRARKCLVLAATLQDLLRGRSARTARVQENVPCADPLGTFPGCSNDRSSLSPSASFSSVPHDKLSCIVNVATNGRRDAKQDWWRTSSFSFSSSSSSSACGGCGGGGGGGGGCWSGGTSM